MAEHRPGGFWKETYHLHLIALEKFLLERRRRSHLRTPAPEFSGERTIYLAGMVARELDFEYKKHSRKYLLDKPEQLESAIRKHAPYIGQNAPLVTLSKINAEHLTIDIAVNKQGSVVFQARLPAGYFSIASFYSSQAGNDTQANIFMFLRNHLDEVIRIIAAYFRFITEYPLNDIIPRDLKKRLGEKSSLRDARLHEALGKASRQFDFHEPN